MSSIKKKHTTISLLIVLSGFLSVVLSHAGEDLLVGTASHYTPIPYSRTACETKVGPSKIPPSVYPAAAGENLWDRGAGCGKRYRVRCISNGAPTVCKTGQEIEVIIGDRAVTMRGRASESGADLVIMESGFRVIADQFARSVQIEYKKV